MKIPLVQVDAFTSQVFRGNPAAICPLESWLDDQTLQSIATENNLSETAFLVGGGGRYAIRWMTPAAEVDLCGHATLASAFVLFGDAEKARDEIVFTSKSGELKVRREGDLLTLDFPSRPPQPMTASEDLLEGLGHPPREVWAARDYLAVFETEDEVRTLAPDFGRLAGGPLRRDRDRARRSRRFRLPVLRPGRNPRGPGDRLRALHADPVLVAAPGQKKLHALQVSPRGGSSSARTSAARSHLRPPSATCKADRDLIRP
jgi:hypothetical protein